VRLRFLVALPVYLFSKILEVGLVKHDCNMAHSNSFNCLFNFHFAWAACPGGLSQHVIYYLCQLWGTQHLLDVVPAHMTLETKGGDGYLNYEIRSAVTKVIVR
jgi:hypothetical protein